MRADLLDVVVPMMNPIRWKVRERQFDAFIDQMMRAGVRLTIAECAIGGRPFMFADDPRLKQPNIRHVGLRAFSVCWNKENVWNLGVPADAQYVACIDADVTFRDPNWAAETVHALQQYEIVQPWSDAITLGPNDEILALHKSFCSLLCKGVPVTVTPPYKWKKDGGTQEYPHPGMAWAYRREALERLGGLFEYGVSGSGDSHMALAYIGQADKSVPQSVRDKCPALMKHMMAWQGRALHHINGNIGFVRGSIEHSFHGAAEKRRYWDRWSIFTDERFDPDTDLKRNTWGVLELSGNKPGLRRKIDEYLRSRDEDSNTLG